jgi:hypothetical protein
MNHAGKAEEKIGCVICCAQYSKGHVRYGAQRDRLGPPLIPLGAMWALILSTLGHKNVNINMVVFVDGGILLDHRGQVDPYAKGWAKVLGNPDVAVNVHRYVDFFRNIHVKLQVQGDPVVCEWICPIHKESLVYFSIL